MRENIGNDVPAVPELLKDFQDAGIEPQTADAVNRTKTGRIEIPVPFPFPPPGDEAQLLKDLKEAQAELAPTDETEFSNAHAARSIFGELAPTTPIIEELVEPESDQKLEMILEGLGFTLPATPRDPDLREFKKQVVSAFKHLGLDTKQFFGV